MVITDFPAEEFTINMGPQHPSTHGVLNVAVTVAGERITTARVNIGFLHRSWEKIVETWTFPQIVPYSDRNDYLGCIHNEHLVCLAVETMLRLQAPPRAEYIRVIMSELQRICSHLLWLGTMALDLGATTVFLWAFRDREKVYDLFELVTGGRVFPQFLRLGGVRNDFPPQFYDQVMQFLADLPHKLKEYQQMLTHNPIFIARTRGIGVISPETALAYAISGPNLRASGIAWDVRKADPYSIYQQFDFEVPYAEAGDSYARYQVRMREVEESKKIIEQALAKIPEGEVITRVPRKVKIPAGEIYCHVESPRGELGLYLVTNGSDQPWRLKWRSPCYANLQPLAQVAKGLLIADLVAYIGSIDIVLGEVDR